MGNSQGTQETSTVKKFILSIIGIGLVALFIAIVVLSVREVEKKAAAEKAAATGNVVTHQVSGQVRGQYIKIMRPNIIGCYGFADIKVYSTPDGPNIITPAMTVTTSSKDDSVTANRWDLRSLNLVDGTDSETSIACNMPSDKSPYFIVNLGEMKPIYQIVIKTRDWKPIYVTGTVLSILDSDNKVVYESNPITSITGKIDVKDIGTVQNLIDTDSYKVFTYTIPSKTPIGTIPGKQ